VPLRLDPVAFVKRHGVVLASARGAVPNLAEAVAGEPVGGSWWAHPRGRAIFRALSMVSESPDVVCLKLLAGKVTFVHRRLWPALARLADRWPRNSLTAVTQVHTESGAHRNLLVAFSRWMPDEARRQGRALSEAEAEEQLGEWSRVPAGQPARQPARTTVRKGRR
jgi:hypothetical protein